MYQSFEALGEKMGGLLQLDHTYTVNSIALSADKKTAIVDVSDALDVGGSIINMKSRSLDTLIRRNGKTLMLRSDADGSVGSGL